MDELEAVIKLGRTRGSRIRMKHVCTLSPMSEYSYLCGQTCGQTVWSSVRSNGEAKRLYTLSDVATFVPAPQSDYPPPPPSENLHTHSTGCNGGGWQEGSKEEDSKREVELALGGVHVRSCAHNHPLARPPAPTRTHARTHTGAVAD